MTNTIAEPSVMLIGDQPLIVEAIQTLLQENTDAKFITHSPVSAVIADGTVIVIIQVGDHKSEIGRMIGTVTAEMPGASIIVYDSLSDSARGLESIKSGARSYLQRNTAKSELIYAFNRVSEGQHYICSELMFDVLTTSNSGTVNILSVTDLDSELTEHELELINYLAEGLINEEIADKLGVTKRSVDGYRQRLLIKLNCKNTASLIRWAFRAGIIT